MTPTPELRFVEREIREPITYKPKIVKILQQKLVGTWEENIAAGKYVDE